MDHTTNKDDTSLHHRLASSKDEEAAFKKLLAIKKIAERKNNSNNAFQPANAAIVPNIINGKGTADAKKDNPITSSNLTNSTPLITKQETINKVTPIASPKVVKVIVPEKNISKEENNQKPFGNKEEVAEILVEKTPLSNTQKTGVITQKRTPPEETMKPTKNSDNVNGARRETEQGKHITDSPYTEKEIPLEGKNLIPRSQEVDDILSYVPNWLVLWGNTVIFLIIGGILVMSYFIKYPDVVEGTISINSVYPPIPLVIKESGTLTLLKQDKEIVYPDEVIGVIKNTADYADVQRLKETLEAFQNKLEQGHNFSYFELPTGLKLGEMQGAYSNLFIKLKEKKIQNQSNTNDQSRKINLDNQLLELENIKQAKEKSLSIKYQEYLKAKSLLDTRYKVLHGKGSISAEQLNAKESEVRNLLDIYQSDRIGFNEIKKRILDLNSGKVEIDFDKDDKEILAQSALITAYETLKTSIRDWEEIYLLKSPIEGKLDFVEYVKNNMYLQQAQILANIIPTLSDSDTSSTFRGELLIPTIGAGKAEIGQVINVALNDYPKKQYGIVEGKVESIADISIPIPNGQGMTGYKVIVSFPNGLETTMKKEIQFKHNMQGSAEIITDDVRLIERFFHELRDLFDAN